MNCAGVTDDQWTVVVHLIWTFVWVVVIQVLHVVPSYVVLFLS